MTNGLSRPALGFLGVGAIAEALVVGFCEGRSGPAVVLSPRSRARAVALASTYANVSVAADNQDVVDAADTVVVCLRPDDAVAELGRLRFGRGQAVISVVAGMRVPTLAPLVAPGQVVARAIPLPAVARREGVMALHCPSGPPPDVLFRFGDVVVVDGEDAFDALSAATSTVAAHFRYLATIADWLVARGVAADVADTYVSRTFAALSGPPHPASLRTGDAEHATPGGINEQFLPSLERDGVFRAMQGALDVVLQRLTGSRPPT